MMLFFRFTLAPALMGVAPEAAADFAPEDTLLLLFTQARRPRHAPDERHALFAADAVFAPAAAYERTLTLPPCCPSVAVRRRGSGLPADSARSPVF